jgi:hypothetical protein
MNAVADLTLRALRGFRRGRCAAYEETLIDACRGGPPPFGEAWYGERYRELSSDPSWLAGSLVANAQKEGDGARKLWDIAGKAPDPTIAGQIRAHAIDESRHALLYLAMLELVFEDAVPPEARPTLEAISPRYCSRDYPVRERPSSLSDVLDEVVQMNIGEIRTRIHQLLLRPVIEAYCPAAKRARLHATLDVLVHDETRHIDYTARILDRAMTRGKGKWIQSVFRARLEEFNAITLTEVGVDSFVGE